MIAAEHKHFAHCMFDLPEEMVIFLNEHNRTLPLFVTVETWFDTLAYLADLLNTR